MNAAAARLFVAIDPPEPVRESLAPICRDLAGAKWTRPGQLHVTLRFLGSVPVEAVAGIAERLRAVSFEPFELTARGFGVFPSFRSPRVLWIALSPAAPLEELHDAVERRLDGAVAPDEKRFSPHLTLARLDGTRGSAVREWIARREAFSTAPWSVPSFSLYASSLTPSGAVHRELGSYPLGRANAAAE
ncbi:MAG TPA: RNA 2',3'-cyclic phosphodiesterase [Thermoanaerobaculia bacterium]|nr:RNA 2',3'-cyclic phosphodiesterase [Thermoanaerobaculia bacterium]